LEDLDTELEGLAPALVADRPPLQVLTLEQLGRVDLVLVLDLVGDADADGTRLGDVDQLVDVLVVEDLGAELQRALVELRLTRLANLEIEAVLPDQPLAGLLGVQQRTEVLATEPRDEQAAQRPQGEINLFNPVVALIRDASPTPPGRNGPCPAPAMPYLLQTTRLSQANDRGTCRTEKNHSAAPFSVFACLQFQTSTIDIHYAAQDLTIAAALPQRPAPHGPGAGANRVRLAIARDGSQALCLGRFQSLLDRPGIAAAAMDSIVLDDGDDARHRQVEEAEGDHLVSGRSVTLLQSEQIVAARRSVGGEPRPRQGEGAPQKGPHRTAPH